jgi:hypothetical protein
MYRGTFGKGVTGAPCAFPPLAKACDLRIVPCHLGIQSPDAPSLVSQAQTEFRFFPGNEAFAVPPERAYRAQPHQGIPPAGQGLSDGSIPFRVAQAVVDGTLRVLLSSPAADNGNILVRGKEGAGLWQPVRINFAVPIDELHQAVVIAWAKRRKPGISGARCGEGP